MDAQHEPWALPQTIRQILRDCQTWAIVGLGDNPDRPAYRVARFLRQHGKRVAPVHPSAAAVLGEPGFARLEDIPFRVDCVDVFRRADAAGRFADDAVRIGAAAVWFQLGVVDQPAFGRASAAGLAMVMDRCPAIEWAAHGPISFPGMSGAG